MRFARFAAVGVAVLLTAIPAQASADSTAPNSRVSRSSPYAACTAGSDETDTSYTNAEVEPAVASNPARRGNLVAVWQQDRWANGGAHGLMAGYSFNGGRTWKRSTLPFSSCAPGGLKYSRASDPAVSIGPDGTVYAIGLSVDIPGTRSAVATAVSRNGGRTWRTVRVIAAENQGGLDKEWVTADPKRAGSAYAVWDNLHVTSDGHFTGPAYFSKTTDFGRTWSKPLAIATTGRDQQSLGNQILVDRHTGRLYDTYGYFYCVCLSTPKVAYVYSDNGGRTWSRQRVVNDNLSIGVVQPGSQYPVRSGGFPLAAISRSGQLYLTWQDSRFSGGSYDEIAVSTSKDRGAHWTKPHRANKPTGRAAFTPSIAVNASGRVAVTYYDLRKDKLRDKLFSVNYWATSTKDGVHFVGDRRLTRSFDLLAAPDARGLFVGDYQGLAAMGNRFVSVFVKTNCTGDNCVRNRTDVYSAAFSASTKGAVAFAPATGSSTNGLEKAKRLQEPRLIR